MNTTTPKKGGVTLPPMPWAHHVFRGMAATKDAPLPSAPTTWDMGATGISNRRGLTAEPATDFDPEINKETRNPNGVTRNRRTSWVGTYAKQGHITNAQQMAAMSLYRAYHALPEGDPLAALRIDAPAGSSDPLASVVDRRRAFRALWVNVPTSSRPVMERVVLDDQPIWHGNSAQRNRHMKRLCAGLDAIC